MPEKWTGELLMIMHNNKIRRTEVAKKLGISQAYTTQILNGAAFDKPASTAAFVKLFLASAHNFTYVL